jgi:uncharacterized tellurite resistance protein B-like protein
MSIADAFENGERKQDKGHFRNLVMIAEADGIVAETETKLLNQIGQKLALSEGDIAEIKKNPKDYRITPPASRAERFEQIIELIQMVHIDGVVEEAEMKMLEKVAVGIGYQDLDEVDVESILALIVRGEDTEVIITELL